ncbi:hypothetical protein Tco_0505097 [Tanacetum coccineum]
MIRMLQNISREDLETLWSTAGTKVNAAELQLLEELLLNRSRIGIKTIGIELLFETLDPRSHGIELMQQSVLCKATLYSNLDGVRDVAQEYGTSLTKMFMPITAEEKTNKKNDVKARSLLFIALPNEHQLTFKSLDSIFNMLQKIVSKLAILGVVISQEDLNLKNLSSLPPEWNTHVVVRMNKAEIETMCTDDCTTTS